MNAIHLRWLTTVFTRQERALRFCCLTSISLALAKPQADHPMCSWLIIVDIRLLYIEINGAYRRRETLRRLRFTTNIKITLNDSIKIKSLNHLAKSSRKITL